MESNAKILIMASLLHDIGKFMQRANVPLDDRYGKIQDVGETGAHARWSAMYAADILKDHVVEDLVLFHHSPQSSKYLQMAEIVKNADHLSSAIDRRERRSDDKGQILKEPLKSVFPMVRLDGRENQADDHVYLLKPLEIGESTFPVKQQRDMRLWNLSDAYKDLWKQFRLESEQLPRDPPVLTVMSLLRKYTSVIPSAVYVNEPDVPLYDHAKTTAAIAHCLFEGDKNEPFLFIEGNLSGIQKFIFSTVIPEQSRKGTAKRLRGRSFWLSLMMDAMAREIARECELFDPAILWNTGGHFLIIAPNTARNREKIAFIDRKVNEHLLRKWNGRLSVIVATFSASTDGIKDFSKVLERLSVIGDEKKRQKFIDCDLNFEPDGYIEPLSQLCPVCGSQVTKDEECSLFLDIGTKLARAKFMIMTVGKDLLISFADLGMQASYDLVPDLPVSHPGEIFAINSTDIRVKHPAGWGFTFVGNSVPMAGQDILTFSEIAQLAKGSPRLGYLKADVDNLGKIFAQGFKPELRTISRLHTLSSQLQYFFAGHINHICDQFVVYRDLCPACMPAAKKVEVVTPGEEGETSKRSIYYEHPGPCKDCRERYAVRKFYITYSGGDDLLVIGPWDDTIRLADALSKEFRRFTCDNPDITLSAGIPIVDPNLPVARVVRQAEELLEQAKSTKGKARVAIFDECLPWREGTGEQGLSSLITTAERLTAFVQDKVVPKNMIYSFLKLWEQSFAVEESSTGKRIMTDEEQWHARITRKRHMPYLKYMLKRNIKDEKKRRDVEELVIPVFPWIRLPVYMTSLALRQEHGD